ncbi:hypothetical protein B0I35DRAFT_378169 [Stachybotrys elegans]|uniref:Glycosyltransferase family 1 protein n=1 Tax=Stachybotrys elegans TaxID=80388 RepID=A0A8K0WME3_9HYPO|nr:hypothetical protein B0I35DRAFT_378169 [Stachybotrys elegans]
MSEMKRLLFFTNSDYGQANVVLATAHALGLTHHDVEIHIASFPDLRPGVEDACSFMQATAAKQGLKMPKPFVFHAMQGSSWGPAMKRPDTAIFKTLELAPGFVNAAKAVALLPAIMIPWEPEEFLQIYQDTERILDQVGPDLTIVEPLCTQALTLCHYRNAKWMVLTPNTIKDFAIPMQPNLAALWKYPMACSALPYPIPWSLIPTNICFCLVAAYAVLTDTRLKRTVEILHKTVSPSVVLMTAMELGVVRAAPENLPILVANSPDIDYPFSVLPAQITSCGPIVRAAPPIQEIDASLAAWLSRGPTICVNLGTHHKSSPDEALEMAWALRRVLEHADKVAPTQRPFQILWKLGRTPDKDGNAPKQDSYTGEWAPVADALQEFVKVDRAKITDWVVAEPKSVLESQSIACAVNHGGSNSFHEALCAGVPQALLPAWTDCYDFANRVELLGIGRWANKRAKPRWEEHELFSALIDVLFGPESAQIRKTAEEVARRHPEYQGRQRAAQEIIDYLAN